MKLVSKFKLQENEDIKIKGLRRADRFSKIAVFCAKNLLKNAGIESFESPDSVAVILSTKFGPHKTTFAFLDDILDYKDTEVSPTKFSHSVHNAAAFYLANFLNLRGPVITVTDFNDPLTPAKMIAESWIKEKRVDYVLLGLIDERSLPMDYISENCDDNIFKNKNKNNLEFGEFYLFKGE